MRLVEPMRMLEAADAIAITESRVVVVVGSSRSSSQTFGGKGEKGAQPENAPAKSLPAGVTGWRALGAAWPYYSAANFQVLNNELPHRRTNKLPLPKSEMRRM